MKFVIAKEVPSIIIISSFLCIMMYLMGQKIKKSDPLKTPKGLAFFGVFIVETVDNLVSKSMDAKSIKNFGPYIGALGAYILISNISGLTGFLNPPTASLSITLTLAMITWIMIERQAIKTNGFLGFIKSLFEPFPLFFIPNIFGQISPLVSMSFRLFGNILSGGIIMTIVYWGCQNLSNFILGFLNLAGFNFMGVIIAPALHMYFDLFAGFMQMFVFISLTMVLIQKEK